MVQVRANTPSSIYEKSSAKSETSREAAPASQTQPEVQKPNQIDPKDARIEGANVRSQALSDGSLRSEALTTQYPVKFKPSLAETPAVFGIGGFGINILGDESGGLTRSISDQAGGSQAQVVSLGFWRNHIEGIKAAHARGQPIVLVGHSMGNGECLNLLERLKEEGIDVDVFVRLDPSYDRYLIKSDAMKSLPSNVKHVVTVNSDGPFQGFPLTRSDISNPKTKVSNFVVHCGHLDMNQPKIIAAVAKKIREQLASQAP